MKAHKGITLVEIMITITLLGMISSVIYYIVSESNRRANLLTARDYTKQETNKILKILENDLTQAFRGSYQDSGNTYSFKVRKSESKDETVKYTYNKPKLHRFYDGKCWLVSNIVDNFEISRSIDNVPGKMVVNLVTKSNFVGIKKEDQPEYEQQKIIVMMEDISNEYDPHWREVGDVSKFFTTQGNLLAGLKEDATQLVENFADTWKQALGDIKNMTVGELQNLSKDLKKNLEDVKKNLTDINKEISELDWHALYDESGLLGRIFGANKRKEKKANKVKEIVSGYKSLSEMNWEQVKSAGKGMKEDAIKAMYDAKVQLFEGQSKIQENIKSVEDQLASVQ